MAAKLCLHVGFFVAVIEFEKRRTRYRLLASEDFFINLDLSVV